MIDTAKFRTKSEIVEKNLPKINGNNQYKGKTIIGIDLGYSSVKLAAPSRVAIFPAFAKKAPDVLDVIGKAEQYDIQLKDNLTGELWLIGQIAEELMDRKDLDSITDESMYTRYRYESPSFKALASAGLALGLIGTAPGNDIYVQTGLPATYKERDELKIKKSFCRDYNMDIKVGNGVWQHFEFTLTEDKVNVMEQPQGTYFSVLFQADGNLSKRGLQIANSNTIVLDIGFGTEDIFAFVKGYKNGHDTFSDTAMKSVFEEVINRIRKECPDADFKIFEFQKYLEEGRAYYLDVDTTTEMEIEFSELLEKVNSELCEKSIVRLLQDYDNLQNYQNLVITGGTGESRFEQIKERLSGLKRLQVFPGNVSNPEISFVYSNVLGYYLSRYAKLKNPGKGGN